MELGGVLGTLWPHNGSRFKTEDELRLSNVSDSGYLYSEPAISIFFLVCIAISTAVGLVGNILVIGAVFVHRPLRTTGNVFIVNLAVADLFVITIVQPFNVIGIVHGEDFFVKMEEVCHVVATVCVMSCANSMMTLAAIALNRYIFVCKNRLYGEIYNKYTTPLMCFCLWVIVSLIDLPNYFGWGRHTFDTKTMVCSFDRLISLSYTLFLSVFIYWVPLFIVVFCYYSIYKYVQRIRRELRKTFSRMSESNNDAILNARREENFRMVRTFFIVVVVFLLCWTPYFVLALFDRTDSGPKVIYVVLLALGHLNSSLNCILYATTSGRFRKGYLEFLCLFNVCSDKKYKDYFNSTQRSRNSLKNASDNSSSANTQIFTLHKSNESLNGKNNEPKLTKFHNKL